MSLRLHAKFSRWLAAWRCRHVSDAQAGACATWLAGRGAGLRPCTTTPYVTNSSTERAPYYAVTKYRVCYEQEARGGGERGGKEEEEEEGEGEGKE